MGLNPLSYSRAIHHSSLNEWLSCSAYHATLLQMKKNPTSIRPSDEGKRLLALLAEKLGVSQVAVLEIIIRDKAKQEQIK
jgi:hypothetical protein